MKGKIKINHQRFMTPSGLKDSYGVTIFKDGEVFMCCFETKDDAWKFAKTIIEGEK